MNHQGFALNKLNQQNDIYSQFSSKQSIRKGFSEVDRSHNATASSVLSSEANSLALESLRQNEYFPMQTYEAFLAKKYRIGKRSLFLNKDLTEEARETMMEHIRVAE